MEYKTPDTIVRRRSASRDEEEQVFIKRADSIVDLEPDSHGFCGMFLMMLTIILDIILFPLTIWCCFEILKTYERGVVLRMGKLTRSRTDPVRTSGVVCKIPIVDQLLKVDTRTRTVNINPQELLTRDSVTVKVDAVVYMHVFDAASALLRVENWKASTELLAVSLVRKVLGKYNLSELLTSRQEIDDALLRMLDTATDKWGIKVERVEITDIVLPTELQRAMAAEAQATRSARSKVLEAHGEVEASKLLHEAADELSASPNALQLRLLQTLSTIAAEQNSTIVFPLPIELMGLIGKKSV